MALQELHYRIGERGVAITGHHVPGTGDVSEFDAREAAEKVWARSPVTRSLICPRTRSSGTPLSVIVATAVFRRSTSTISIGLTCFTGTIGPEDL
ncbi:MAG: hypothetical protein H6522_09400 [Mycolicibacterium sp.]|nr:hypothetical protein [Mycolicibacterium sp.]